MGYGEKSTSGIDEINDRENYLNEMMLKIVLNTKCMNDGEIENIKKNITKKISNISSIKSIYFQDFSGNFQN
jgi:hypothetical protein